MFWRVLGSFGLFLVGFYLGQQMVGRARPTQEHLKHLQEGGPATGKPLSISHEGNEETGPRSSP